MGWWTAVTCFITGKSYFNRVQQCKQWLQCQQSCQKNRPSEQTLRTRPLPGPRVPVPRPCVLTPANSSARPPAFMPILTQILHVSFLLAIGCKCLLREGWTFSRKRRDWNDFRVVVPFSGRTQRLWRRIAPFRPGTGSAGWVCYGRIVFLFFFWSIFHSSSFDIQSDNQNRYETLFKIATKKNNTTKRVWGSNSNQALFQRVCDDSIYFHQTAFVLSHLTNLTSCN